MSAGRPFAQPAPGIELTNVMTAQRSGCSAYFCGTRLRGYPSWTAGSCSDRGHSPVVTRPLGSPQRMASIIIVRGDSGLRLRSLSRLSAMARNHASPARGYTAGAVGEPAVAARDDAAARWRGSCRGLPRPGHNLWVVERLPDLRGGHEQDLDCRSQRQQAAKRSGNLDDIGLERRQRSRTCRGAARTVRSQYGHQAGTSPIRITARPTRCPYRRREQCFQQRPARGSAATPTTSSVDAMMTVRRPGCR